MKKSRHGSKNRFQIMPYDQILRLFRLLNGRLMICCELDSDEPLELTLWDIVTEMRSVLEIENIKIKDIRLIGGAATYVISCSDSFCYKDIDIVFSLHSCNSLDIMTRIRNSVLLAITRLMERDKVFLKGASNPERYIKKQVCIQNQNIKDYWSLFSLGSGTDVNSDEVELKFASSVERQYECSVDSFQIVLGPVLHFYEQYGCDKITKDLHPTVVTESAWGPIKTAFSHLRNKHIFIDNPEQIRGGGLLKYCKLLLEGFKPHPDLDVKYVEKYMCSRFFIDFPLLTNQHDKIISYLLNHFPLNYDLYIRFLRLLSRIVKTSSVQVGIDRRRSVFLINSIMQQIWTICQPRISLTQFNDREKWSVGEIRFGGHDHARNRKSSCSSISSPTDTSTELSLDIDSCHDDSSVT